MTTFVSFLVTSSFTWQIIVNMMEVQVKRKKFLSIFIAFLKKTELHDNH